MVSEQWITTTREAVQVQVLPTTKYKMVTVLATMEYPLMREWVTSVSLLPRVLLRGTAVHRTPESLIKAFDALYGAGMSIRAGKHGDAQTLELSLQVPAEEFLSNASGLFGKAIRLFADVLLNPFLENGVFSTHAVDIEKTLQKQRIENMINDKIAYASDRLVSLMCAGEPFGIPKYGYIEDIESISPASLYADYLRLLKNSQLHVHVVGNVQAELITEEVFSVFSGFLNHDPSTAFMVGAMSMPAIAPEVRVHVEELEVNQGKLNIGMRGAVHYADDDYPALLVYNGVLGGFPHSKLFTNVREKASLAYYASSRLEGLKGLIFISSGIQVTDYDRAKEIMEAQVEAMRTGDISDDELHFTKTGLINQYRQSDDQPLTGAMMQLFARLSGRERTVPELLKEIESVSKEDVVRVAEQVQLDTVYFLRDKEL